MDPLVRTAVKVQEFVRKCSGLGLSVGLGGYLVYGVADPLPLPWNAGALTLLLVTLGFRVARRLRALLPEESTRLDLELFTALLVLTYALIVHAPGGLDGPYYPAVYALVMFGASFVRPLAAVGTVAFAVLLETALDFVTSGGRQADRLLPHAALLGVFAFLNMLVFRAELARIRALSRQRIEAELSKMKEAARSYRLLAAPSAPGERPSSPGANDEDRVLRSGVDEIHQAVEFALTLLCRTLHLRTALLLGLDSSGNHLHIQELVSLDDAIANGPFNARDGIFGASLARGEQVSLAGPKACAHVPYYTQKPAIGGVSATPILDRRKPRGLLVVDRETRDPWSALEEEMLSSAAHFIRRAIENERVFVQLERAKVEQGKLYRAANALASATTEAQVVEAGVNGAREFAAFDLAVVTLFDASSGEHEICAVSGPGAEGLVGQRFKQNSGLVSMVVANRHALPYRGDYDPSRQIVFTRRVAPPPMPALLVLPLSVHERALGTLVLGSHRKGAFGDSVRPTLEVLASHVAVSLANARMLKRLEELATTDGLTGLLNKRTLSEVGVQKLKSALRFRKPLSLLVCDIDHFKLVNDTYGHHVGDLVIRGFADLLKRVKRDTDAVGRFGGEEFVVVCEETDERGATQLAERIRSELETTQFSSELGSFRVTCSVGVAPCPSAGQTWPALFKATDEALYASKRGGRNRVTVWSPKLQPAALRAESSEESAFQSARAL
jgi:two-component system, cell cycle response regulator